MNNYFVNKKNSGPWISSFHSHNLSDHLYKYILFFFISTYFLLLSKSFIFSVEAKAFPAYRYVFFPTILPFTCIYAFAWFFTLNFNFGESEFFFSGKMSCVGRFWSLFGSGLHAFSFLGRHADAPTVPELAVDDHRLRKRIFFLVFLGGILLTWAVPWWQNYWKWIKFSDDCESSRIWIFDSVWLFYLHFKLFWVQFSS